MRDDVVVMSSAFVVIAFVAAGALLVWTSVAKTRGVFRAQAAMAPHAVSLDALGRRVESFVGGARWPMGNATVPLARLDFHEYSLRIHGVNRLLDRLVPDWTARYTDITEAVPVETPLRSSGLRVRVPGPTGWIIFWSSGGAERLVARLAPVGVAVGPPRRLRRWRYDD